MLKILNYYFLAVFHTWSLCYAGTISAESGTAILGFLVQAWNSADERIGTFATGAGQQNLDCSNINSVPAAVSV